MTRHILITGAIGKTGAFAVGRLLGQGHQVRALVHRGGLGRRLGRSLGSARSASLGCLLSGVVAQLGQ
jgi:uncharacterized protein YbjT (DUF2867 family)